MLAGDITNSGAIPALEMAVRFAARRQAVIAGNVANLTTPDYRPLDLSVDEFRRVLGEAVERRRAEGVGGGGGAGPLVWSETAELKRGARGELVVQATTAGRGILAHDRNNRDLERLMQAQAENAIAFRVATELLRGRFEQLRVAIGERP
ncbi:MAG: flagellar basal body rod protein FlgB [Phycisphaerales bacterium]